MEEVAFWTLILALGYLVYGPWQKQVEDWGRQELFEIRDAIFDLAAEGKIAFDDPRYRTIRQSVNLLIRFMHECTWPKLIFIALVLQRGERSRWRRSQFEIAVRRIEDPNLRREIRAMTQRMGYVIVLVMIRRSPLLLALGWTANFIADLASVIGDVARRSGQIKQKIYGRLSTIALRDAELVQGGLPSASAVA